MNIDQQLEQELHQLAATGNLRTLPALQHDGRYLWAQGRRMLNLSSNDYLGLATREELRTEFLSSINAKNFVPGASSSRLLTGNHSVHQALEEQLAEAFGTPAALLFNSGYHANIGILPAIADGHTLVLADKLVHASLIDGIRLSMARVIRFRHADYQQLQRLVLEHTDEYRRIIIVTESLFSMDGDVADLRRLVAIKQSCPHALLYVDEAHAFGVRGPGGLGCAHEQGCAHDIDLLVGTFGKALASVGAFVVCSEAMRSYLINRMRPLIYSTALPPICVAWSAFLLCRLPQFEAERKHLLYISARIREELRAASINNISQSHIVPLIVGSSTNAIERAAQLQSGGIYALPVRPPTVPEGTARIRLSLTAALTRSDIEQTIALIISTATR